MAIEYVSFGGWKNNLRVANGHAEIIVTLDVGPRVISYRTAGGANVFKVFTEQLGGTGERDWKARGGHRFWLAPEDPVMSYIPDNGPVEHCVVSPHEVELTNPPTDLLPVRKTLTIALDPTSSRVAITHRAENRGVDARTLATWGLSVMQPGGTEIIPLPPAGEHPRDLLPNRTMVLWPYTDMSDRRWQWGERFITLRQADAAPTKIGLGHRECWAAYLRAGCLFVKSFSFEEGVSYPDGGCNFETFTKEEMLEVEALGPLTKLAPSASTAHTEYWTLVENAGEPADWKNDEIHSWISPLLNRALVSGS